MKQKTGYFRKFIYFWTAAAAAVCLISCGGNEQSSDKPAVSETQPADETQTAAAEEKKTGKIVYPSFHEAVFDTEKTEGNEEVKIDLSEAEHGYFGVWSDSDEKLKLKVKKEGSGDAENEYIYDLVKGETDFFPFQDGDGSYTIRVMKNAEEKKYFELYSATAQVKLENEFEPFLVSCQYADYTKDSECVKLAEELAASSEDEKGFITKVYEYVCDNVKYDGEKAKDLETGYIPDPDETLKTKKGVCFDYAALTASMLRSRGVPTKIIFGYVAPDNIYHAWNMFYTEEEGWTAVRFRADPNNWNRLDLTFLANGSDSGFTGDGTNYTDLYQY